MTDQPPTRGSVLLAASAVLLLVTFAVGYRLTRNPTITAAQVTAPTTTRTDTTTSSIPVTVADLTTSTAQPDITTTTRAATTPTTAAGTPATMTGATTITTTTTTAATSPATTTTPQPAIPIIEKTEAAMPTTTTAPEPTSTTFAVSAVVEGGDHEHHDGVVPDEEDCHTHRVAVSPLCDPEEYPSTTLPDPNAPGDCPGNYHQWFKVRDECVLSEVRKEFLDHMAGNHSQRMASIRDGHLLREMFVESQVGAEQYFGKEAANDLNAWTSVYADVDNRDTRRVELYGAQWIDRDRIDVRIRAVMKDGSFAWGWSVVPFTYVDGEWKISYQGFCRFIERSIASVEAHGGTASPCPPDPRPDLVALEYVIAAYDPTDDPTRTEVNLTPGW